MIVRTTRTTPENVNKIPTSNNHNGEAFHSYQESEDISPTSKKNAEASCLINMDIILPKTQLVLKPDLPTTEHGIKPNCNYSHTQ